MSSSIRHNKNIIETINHSDLADMPDVDGSNTDHDLAYLRLDGTTIPTAAIGWGGQDITNVGDISLDTISAAGTKIHINSIIGFGLSSFDLDENSQIEMRLDGGKNFCIDGETNLRTMTEGLVELNHKPAIVGTRVFTLNVDANNRSGTTGMVTNYTATGVSAGEIVVGQVINVDTADSTGGNIHSFIVNKIGTGSLTVEGYVVGPGVVPIHQYSGTETAIEQAWLYDDSAASWTDATTDFSTSGAGLTIFAEDNDVVYVGVATKFDDIAFNLDTVAVNPGVKPTFEFSVGSGSWTSFGPLDGTNGMRVSGNVIWDTDDLSGWATDTVNGTANKYWVRVTRTTNSLSTVPIEDTVKYIASVEYLWDENGDLSIASLNVNGGNIINVGKLGINTASPDAMVEIVADASTEECLHLKGAASQSASLLTMTDSANNLFIDSGDGLTGSVFSGNIQLVDIDFVWAGSTEANLFRIDTGTDTVRIGDWDTNYFTTDKAGDTWWVGGGGLIFGHMYVVGASTITVAITQNVLTEVEDASEDGWNAGELNLITFPTGGTEHYLTVTKPGKYKIDWDMSISTTIASGGEIHGGIMINGTAVRDKGEGHRTIGAANDSGSINGHAILDLTAGTEEISLWLQNTTNNNDVVVGHGNVTVTLKGGT